LKTITLKLKETLFKLEVHPYRIFEEEVSRHLQKSHVILDAGCGREATLLKRFYGKAKKLVGVDLVEFDPNVRGTDIELLNNDLTQIKLPNGLIDITISRSVLEHIEKPLLVYREIFRILKPGGYFIFLAPNLGHYSALISKLVPNRFHSGIILRMEGRMEDDTFPTYYRSNTVQSIGNLARRAGFELVSFKYSGQHPSYFMFNPILFLLTAGYEKLVAKFEILRYLRGWLLVVLRKPTPDASISVGVR
jgi:SAM-dependent methyltransferase